MKTTILRYLAKIRSVLKQEGLIKGVFIVVSSLSKLLKFAGNADILFVSSGVIGDSWRYRVKNVSEELLINGISSEIVIQENFWLSKYANRFKVFVFHRVSKSEGLEKLIREIKKQKKTIIFETDDLVFDTESLKQQSFFQACNEAERKHLEESGFLVKDSDVEFCTTATSFLAEKLKEKEKKVFVIKNKLSKNDLEIAESVLGTKRSNEGKIKIGYFSGTHSHNKDFAEISDALVEIMEKYENVELCLVGPLDIESKLNKFAERVKQFPYVERKKHFENIASVDINIVPLEKNNPFCEGKSQLKFFEAAIVKVVTIASATQTFKETIVDGFDGFLANSNEEWILKLSQLVENADLRKKMAEKAWQKSMKEYTTINAKNEEYYNYLRSKI